MQNILLTSTLHDPNGTLLEPLSKSTDVVLSNYRGWVFSITTATDQRVKEFLKSQENRGIYITKPDLTKPIVPNKIENDHLNALQGALVIAKQLGINKIQYTDWDRIVVAAKYFPEDFIKMAEMAAGIDDTGSYLNLRRSRKDLLTHHPPLVHTETEFSGLYSKAFGKPIDIGSTAHVMSRDLVEEILRRSPQMEPVNFPEPKWIIIAKEAGATIKSAETHNVLTFETPEQFREQIGAEVAENYQSVQQTYMDTLGAASNKSPKEWELRFETLRQYLILIQNHLDIFCFNSNQKEDFERELQRSLRYLEGWQETMTEALEGAPKGPER